MIYLDYASNTPADPAVLAAFAKAEAGFPGNPGSAHGLGRLAGAEMERITAGIAGMLGVKPSEIIFTSGASEANNLALKGLARGSRHSGRHIISTCLEHASVSGALTALQEQGYEIELVDILPNGTADLKHLRELLRKDTVIVSVCMADSELGAIQPVDEIAGILRDYPNCHLHADATQAMGKLPAGFEGIDCMSFAPHKFYGLNGCGALIKREGIVLEPLIHGGASTTIYRSGTPALALAASMETALGLALQERDTRFERVRGLRGRLLGALKKYPLVRINSPSAGSPYIVNLSVKGVKGDDFQAALDAKGVCVSVKSACSVKGTPSRPVYAVTRDKRNAACSWRISLSHLTTEDELESFDHIFDACYRELTE
ncbi:aminotransferase [Clostridia bacterium]|nr:aminotransferase [Clostridia bacterium]